MKGGVRLHPAQFSGLLRAGILLCLAAGRPILRMAVLAACFFAVYSLWHTARLCWQPGLIRLRLGRFLRCEAVFYTHTLAAAQLKVTPAGRLFGVCRLTLCGVRGGRLRLALSPQTARRLAEELFPAPKTDARFEPGGFFRLALAALTADIAATAVLVGVALWRLERLAGPLGQFFYLPARRLLRALLPAGLGALFLSLLFLALLRGALQTAGLSACRAGDILLLRSGFPVRVCWRVRLSRIEGATIRLGLWARLLGCRPVSLRVGAFRGGRLPLVVLRRDEDDRLSRFLPGFHLPHTLPKRPRRRSVWRFLALPAVFSAAALTLTRAVWGTPAAPAAGLLTAVCLWDVFLRLESFFSGGACPAGRLWFFRHTARLHTEQLLLRKERTVLRLRQSPFAARRGLWDLRVQGVGHKDLKLRELDPAVLSDGAFPE